MVRGSERYSINLTVDGSDFFVSCTCPYFDRDLYEQEVKVERSGTGSERRRRADYAFLAPNFRDVRFYVEARKTSLDFDNRDYYFQTIRYGWNSRTPLAVLTDFEQFRALDCRYEPDIEDVLNRALLKFHYTDYADRERFSEIYHLFSRESVTAGRSKSLPPGFQNPKAKLASAHCFRRAATRALTNLSCNAWMSTAKN